MLEQATTLFCNRQSWRQRRLGHLHRALEHWNHQKKPAVFALAEYNAGASRAQRWANNDPQTAMSERTFRSNIDFPGTRNYVRSVLERYEFYRKRGRM